MKMGRRRADGGDGEKVILKSNEILGNLRYPKKLKVPRNAANARERTRMRVLSKAFGRLKLTLPWVPPDTKVLYDKM